MSRSRRERADSPLEAVSEGSVTSWRPFLRKLENPRLKDKARTVGVGGAEKSKGES